MPKLSQTVLNQQRGVDDGGWEWVADGGQERQSAGVGAERRAGRCARLYSYFISFFFNLFLMPVHGNSFSAGGGDVQYHPNGDGGALHLNGTTRTRTPSNQNKGENAGGREWERDNDSEQVWERNGRQAGRCA
jgi:hypothetical protein